jgi:hypothetical protein
VRHDCSSENVRHQRCVRRGLRRATQSEVTTPGYLIRKGEILRKSFSRHQSWMLKHLTVFCAFHVVCGAAAFGQDQSPSSDAPENPSDLAILSYGRNNVSCMEWSDSCVTCKRHQTGGEYSCSNIGIACQPKNVQCLQRGDEPKTDK